MFRHQPKRLSGLARKVLTSVALTAAMTGGALTTSSSVSAAPETPPSTMASVTCYGGIGYSSANGGNAWANNCYHYSDDRVRLVAVCNFLPGNGYSPSFHWFENWNIWTSSCTFGAKEAYFEHH